jgi:hypothetical protein
MPFQIQIGAGKGRFQEKLGEILPGMGYGRRGSVFLAKGVKRLGKKLVHTLEMPTEYFLLHQPFQLGFSNLNRHLRCALSAFLYSMVSRIPVGSFTRRARQHLGPRARRGGLAAIPTAP